MLDFDTSTGEIYIYDEIGPAWAGMIDSASVVDAIKQMSKSQRLTVRINSPGGSVDEGVGIFNALSRHAGGVDTVVDSLAASIANYIFMVGESRLIAPNAKAMIHKPWSLAYGNAEELRKTADLLDKYAASIEGTYAEKMDITAEEVDRIMSDETWYLADEAVAAGMATAVGLEVSDVVPVGVAAGRYKNTPTDMVIKIAAGSKTDAPKPAHHRNQSEARSKRIRATLDI